MYTEEIDLVWMHVVFGPKVALRKRLMCLTHMLRKALAEVEGGEFNLGQWEGNGETCF